MRLSNIKLISLTIVINFLCVASCSTKTKSDIDFVKSEFEVKSDTVKPLQISLLSGIWWLTPDDIHALFYVIGDSLYYTEEQHSPYFIELKNNTLIMSRDSAIFRFGIRKITNDSLVLFDQNMNEVVKLYKTKTKK